jgi:zinc protease
MKRLLVCCLFLLLCLPAPARASVEEVHGKGATAWLVQAHDVPVFTLRLAFTNAGWASDPKNREGLANLVASTLTEGAGGMNALAFHKALEDKAIRLSVDANADMLVVNLESLSEYRDQALKLLSLMLAHPRFDADALARAKAQTLAAIRQRQEDPQSVADDAWRALVWPQSPYGRPALGTESGVSAVTPRELAVFVQAHLARDRLLVAASGDLTPAQLQPWLDSLPATLPATASAEDTTPYAAIAPQGKTEQIKRDIPQTVVLFGFQGIKRNDPRYYAAYVLNHIFGGGELDTRLMVNLRGKEGLVYFAYTDLDDNAQADAWRGAFASETDKLPRALEIWRKSLSDLLEKGVTQAELTDAKRFIEGSFPTHIANNGAVAGYLINMQYYHLGPDYLQKRNGYIDAVTLKQVNAVAHDLLSGKTPFVATVGRP